jgi:hypothetical protein
MDLEKCTNIPVSLATEVLSYPESICSQHKVGTVTLLTEDIQTVEHVKIQERLSSFSSIVYLQTKRNRLCYTTSSSSDQETIDVESNSAPLAASSLMSAVQAVPVHAQHTFWSSSSLSDEQRSSDVRQNEA